MSFPKATILALRGELSRQRVGGERKMLLGDPGILASEVMAQREPKKYVLGIVPHYSEKNDPVFGKLVQRLSPRVTLIDAQNDPLAVISAIDQCENILSSSLHGLIVADSLGIPNRWLGSAKLWGGRFKFNDYYSGIGVRAEPTSVGGGESLAELVALAQPKPGAQIQEKKEAMRGLWASLAKYR